MKTIDGQEIIMVKTRKLSKEEFAGIIKTQIDRCIDNEAYLGALTIIYAFMDYMAGDGTTASWMDKYMPARNPESIKPMVRVSRG